MSMILSLDQGTTSSRAILFDREGTIRGVAQQEFQQFYPEAGWVEHDPEEIWTSQRDVARQVIAEAGISSKEIAAIGITNQRETTIVWDRKTGVSIHPAIVWQDRRTASICDQLKAEGKAVVIQNKTGLVVDAYFSGTKIQWILDHVPGARAKAEKGELACGTVDSWLVWKMTGGKVHVTDPSNASRTMLYNITTREWDDELLSALNVPRSMMPKVVPSSYVFGETTPDFLSSSLPISGIAGDQQAALFGQNCVRHGMAKNTYGTGCFMLMNVGDQVRQSKNRLLATVAWQTGMDEPYAYALEGSVFIAGAAIQWLRDGLGIVQSSSEIEALASSVPDNGGVYFVPALSGLGAPHWDAYARGTIQGITRGTTKAHLARAALEGIAFQVADVLDAMRQDSGLAIEELRCDGGASVNNLLMQFQADILQAAVVRPKVVETTALGAAYLAGLAVGFWKNAEEVQAIWQSDRVFEPSMAPSEVKRIREQWSEAVHRSQQWIRP
ncbi:MAG: glycerol kinase GlpK [Planctomycetota bacterium]|jgi:glycerol kinase|nr:glycerol kinase GlpK [Planctomycetota bacterium]